MIFRRREPDYRVRLWEDNHGDWQYEVKKGRKTICKRDSKRSGERGRELAKKWAEEAIREHAARSLRETHEFTVPAVQARQEVLERELFDAA